MKKQNDQSAATMIYQSKPWENNKNEIWIASTLKFYRNIEKYLFPDKLDPDSRKQILELSKNYLISSSYLKNGIFFPAETISHTDKEFLLEHFLASDGFLHAHSGEGFVTDDTGQFLAVINICNHLQLQLTETNEDLENALSCLINIESDLNIPFAFSSKFGYLTSDPLLCGTAFVVNVFLHLPALIYSNQLNEIMSQQYFAITTSGIQGDPNNLLGNILRIHNQQTLGITETDIIENLQNYSTKLIIAEKSLKTKWKNNPPDYIKDKINRSFGLLKLSYQLKTIESLEAISACKLGIDLGLISGIDHTTINALFFNIRKAHLLNILHKDAKTEDITKLRAKYLHESFKSAKLIN